MIYTVTFNPSLDLNLSLERYQEGIVNRTNGEYILTGGKGINVSTILTNLSIENVALGFVAGFTGEEIVRRLNKMKCHTDFIKLDNGLSRINVKIKAEKETEINASGPDIDRENVSRLMDKLDLLKSNDILVLAGSIPKSLSQTMYMDIMEKLKGRDIDIVVDATGELLMNVLQYKPFLIKPNKAELGELFGEEIRDRRQAEKAAKVLQQKGARNVLVSLAGEGAVMLCEDGNVYDRPAPEGKVVNSVGAGDSMVAGFLAGYTKYKNYEKAFKMGLSAGSASVFSKDLATKEEIMEVYERIKD